MAKRCLNTMVVDGQLVTLMQISDYSILNTSGNPVMVYESSNPPDSYISEYGYDLCAFFPTALHSGEPDVYKDIEDTTAYLKQRYYYDSSIEQNDISIYSNTGTRWMGAGYAITNQDLIGFNLALVVDDDEQKAWVLGCIFLRGQYYRLWLLNDSSQYSAIYNEIKSIDGLSPSGGAGSGYIGNTLVSNKKMVGYNIPTSSAESTKTESVNEASESPVSGKPKIGNGFAKIKLIKEAPVPPSNYIAWLDPEFGVNNLVISKPLQATNVKVVEDYYVADTSSSWSSFIIIPVNMPFTSDIDLIIDLDVYVGNEDNENSTDYGFELYFNLNRNNNNRVVGMTMRNSRWASGANINYDIWGNTALHSIYSVFDNTNNNYKWVNLKVVLGFRSGQWVSSKSYIDDTLFQEYTYSGNNMGSNNIDNIETALPANACTYRIKSYKIYTQTPS